MKPFLKWAGGKQLLVRHIIPILPKGKRLIEPFVGSGAIFASSEYERYCLADNNQDLINLFQQLKKDGTNFIDYVQTFFVDKNNQKQRFLELREQFNTSDDNQLKAALFVYLNRYGYNGLCRYNSKGIYNVPFGQYKKPHFPKEQMLNFHKKLKRANLKCADFTKTMQAAKTGDVIYCDPPYAPLSSTSNFTQYSQQNFDLKKQKILSIEAEKCANRGIPVVISNHDNEFTREIYKNAEIISFEVQRHISCNADNRGKVRELLAEFK